MEELTLNTQTRKVTGKQLKPLRKEGMAPVVLYGPGIESTSLQVEAGKLAEVVAQAGSAQPVKLTIDAKKKVHQALVKEVQRDSLTQAIIHVDFLRLS